MRGSPGWMGLLLMPLLAGCPWPGPELALAPHAPVDHSPARASGAAWVLERDLDGDGAVERLQLSRRDGRLWLGLTDTRGQTLEDTDLMAADSGYERPGQVSTFALDSADVSGDGRPEILVAAASDVHRLRLLVLSWYPAGLQQRLDRTFTLTHPARVGVRAVQLDDDPALEVALLASDAVDQPLHPRGVRFSNGYQLLALDDVRQRLRVLARATPPDGRYSDARLLSVSPDATMTVDARDLQSGERERRAYRLVDGRLVRMPAGDAPVQLARTND